MTGVQTCALPICPSILSKWIWGPSHGHHIVDITKGKKEGGINHTCDDTQSLAGGLSGIGLGLGPGGQPIDATQLNRGGGMGSMGPGGNDLFFTF